MRPLQDQCEPASLEAIEGVFISETGQRFDEVFDNFDPVRVSAQSPRMPLTALCRSPSALRVWHRCTRRTIERPARMSLSRCAT